MGVVDGHMAVSTFDVPPAFEGCEHHEENGAAATLIFIVIVGAAPRLRGDLCSGFGHQLLEVSPKETRGRPDLVTKHRGPPPFDQLLVHAIDHRFVRIQGTDDLAVASTFAHA